MNDVKIARRSVLLGGVAGLGAALLGCSTGPALLDRPPAPPAPSAPSAERELAAIEARFDGRLGVFALDTGSGAVVSHRGDERFLMASTTKAFIAAAVLQQAESDPALLDRLIRYDQSDLRANSPIAEQNVSTGMTIADLCDATITYSDNTAANLLFDVVGGPPAVTGFVRGLGDPITRFDRLEPDLSVSAGPDDVRDTTTPSWIVRDLQAVTLGDGLDPTGRDRLVGWLVANTTGDAAIRAGVPAGWRVGDKTGTGFDGQRNDIDIERNDIAVMWPPDRAPLLLAVLTAPNDRDADADTGNAMIAAATAAVAAALTPS